MIPKIIHYCWFSHDNPPNYPQDVIDCINSWRKLMPDYEIKLWNADNFDLSSCQYAMEAYHERKYAFASDYARLRILYELGGVYCDTDVEALKRFDPLLENEAFTGFEDYGRVAAGILGSEKGNPLFKEFLDYYEGRQFIIGDGVYDIAPIPELMTRTLKKYGLTAENKIQHLGRITVYPIEYFYPYIPYIKEHNFFSENTIANHHYSGTWTKASNEREERYKKHIATYQKIFGKNIGRVFALLQHAGLSKTIGIVRQKLSRKFRR